MQQIDANAWTDNLINMSRTFSNITISLSPLRWLVKLPLRQISELP